MPTVKANGISLAYETSGDPAGPAMVLVMGLGMPLSFWPDAFVDGIVKAGFRVVRFDNRDSGLSERVEGGLHAAIPVAMARSMMGLEVHSPYTLADMAGDVVGLLDALGIAKANVVGVSLGGMVAQVLAARNPGRVASLTSIMSSSGNPFVSMARPRALGAILHRPDDPDDSASVTEHLMHVMETIGSRAYPPDAKALRELCERVARRGYDPHGTARQLLAMLASGDRREEIKTIRVPTLVVHGTDDPLVPKAAGREVARLVPGAKLLELEGMGHDLPAELIPQIVSAIVTMGSGSRT